MYAEVGQLSHQYQQNKQLTFLDLDDTHIEYAQLNHKVHVDINPGTQGAQPFIKSKPVGMWYSEYMVRGGGAIESKGHKLIFVCMACIFSGDDFQRG